MAAPAPLDIAAIRHILALMLLALLGPDPSSAGLHLPELSRLFKRRK